MDHQALLEPDSAPGTHPAPTGAPTGILRRSGRSGTAGVVVALTLVLVAGAVVAVRTLGAAGAPEGGTVQAIRVTVPPPSLDLTGTPPAGASAATGAGGGSGAAASPGAAAGVRLSVPETVDVPGAVTGLPWPAQGQAALAVQGVGTVGTSGRVGSAVPIASVAKVMTAYIVLRHHPLGATGAGPTITVQAAEAAAYADEVARHESVVKVTAGERLTERQALQALLLASANNMARILARWEAGTPAAFVARMNATAARLGMSHTHYTDPSGLDGGTVSTATDQLRLARQALTEPAFAAIVAQTSAVIPVAGTITNYNTLLGRDGIIGIKTGSTTAAGGCLLFAARRTLAGRTVTILGAVLGQPGTRSTILPHALAAADALVRAAGTAVREVTLIHAGQAVATGTAPDGTTTTLTAADDVTVTGWSGLRFRLAIVPGKTRPRLRVAGTSTSSAVTITLVPRPTG